MAIPVLIPQWRFVLASLCLVACAISSAAVPEVTPSFTGNSLTDSEIRFTPDKPAQKTLLIFWASWCRYCMAEIPQLKAMHGAHHPNLRLLGINVNREKADGLGVQQLRELPYPSLWDPELKVSDRFGIKGTPGFIVVDEQGQITAFDTRLSESIFTALERPE